jgi:hypothetical protein
MTRIIALALASVAFTAPAFAQDAATASEATTVSTATYTFDLDNNAGSIGGSLNDYEEARPGEASGPDVTFELD